MWDKVNFSNFADNWMKNRQRIRMNVWRVRMSRYQRTFRFWLDSEHDPDPGILNGISATVGWSNFKILPD